VSALVVVQGVEMSQGAATSVEEIGVDVQTDVAKLRSGEWTPAALLELCLDGVEDDGREQDWRDYVSAVALAAEVTS
jgi:hypothetical protein